MRLSLSTTTLIIAAAFVASVNGTAVPSGFDHRGNPFKVGFQRAIKKHQGNGLKDFAGAKNNNSLGLDVELRGGGSRADIATCSGSPPAILKWAYSAVGLGVTAAWTTIVITTIRSNQPLGAMMPCYQHPLVNRISVLSAVPLILSTYATLRSAADSDSWESLSSPSSRRHNLAMVATGVAGALWVNFAPVITKIPGTVPLASHQCYTGVMKAALIGAYASSAALSACVWQRSLPDDVRTCNPIACVGRVADGVAASLVSIAPANTNNPVNVKYSLLTAGFLLLTAVQTLGPHPLAVIPSWTGRRLARAFPAWTLLAAVTSYDLKEATEKKLLLLDQNYKTLSNGMKGFGVVYLASKVGAIFLDPSFPESYHAVQLVPGWAAAAIVFATLTLRSDHESPVPLGAK